MAGKTKISFGNMALSQVQSAGWKLLTGAINKNSGYGIFTEKGDPFYIGLVDYDNKLGISSLFPSWGNFKPGSLFDGITLGSKTSKNKNLVDAGCEAFSYTINNQITTAPVEQGGFLSVNKVRTPITGQVTYVSTGTEKQRSYFERALQKASDSLQTFYLKTPVFKLKQVNITGYTVSQSSEAGGQIFKYLISFSEVVKTASIASASNATAYSGSSQNTGTLEPQNATGSQKQAAVKKS